MRCRLAFNQTIDGRLLVTLEALWGFSNVDDGAFSLTSFEDENIFIQRVVYAGFSHEHSIDLIAGVILVVAGAKEQEHWFTIDMNERQLLTLGLNTPEQAEHNEPSAEPQSPFGFRSVDDLRRVFDEAPIPICVVSGPEHLITYINTPYVKIIGRDSRGSVLQKTVREALPELQGQPFFALLDNVYRTGKPYTGIATLAKLWNSTKNVIEDRYFDFIYHPLRDQDGEICGIACQANEVTEEVLERHVREEREAQLYRQWAELNAIYRDSPLGMCLISARDLTVLRVNETKARLLGLPEKQILGKKITDLVAEVPDIGNAYLHAIKAKTAEQYEVRVDSVDTPGTYSTWLWILNPVLDASGDVESVASIVMEVPQQPNILLGSALSEAAVRR